MAMGLWDSCGFFGSDSMICPWYLFEMSVVFLLDSYDISMRLLWVLNWISIEYVYDLLMIWL